METYFYFTVFCAFCGACFDPQAELIKNMVEEGLLTPQHAEEFLEEISNDLQRMDKDRNKMYWYVVSYFFLIVFVL